MNEPARKSESVYCVVCRSSHESPVAIAVNDRCPKYQHTRNCEDYRFCVHAESGDDAECICGAGDRS